MRSHEFLYPDTLIIIFAREPVYGLVKTRLIPALGKQGATELYQRFLNYTIGQYITRDQPLNSATLAPVNLCITPDSRESYFQALPHSDRFSCTKQRGQDLGARMYNALADGLKNYSKAILIGTDCPFLGLNDVRQAITALDTNDVVFSPASDGGYVLVGAAKLDAVIFKDIDWGTDRVMEQTRNKMKAKGISWQELAVKNDIDIEADLKYLLEYDEFKDLLNILYSH